MLAMKMPGGRSAGPAHLLLPVPSLKPVSRRLPAGADLCAEGVHFRVWAPKSRTVSVVFEEKETRLALEPEGNGFFAGTAKGAEAGTVYRYRLDERRLPRSVFALSAGRAARAFAGHRSLRVFVDATASGRGAARGAGDLRDAHRHLHARKGRGARRGGAAGAAGTRHHAAGSHAGRGLPRPLWLGIRWRGSFRADAPLWRAG